MIEQLTNINWLAILIACAISYAFFDRHKKRPIINKMESDRWQSLDTFPKEGDLEDEVIITDGKRTGTIRYPQYDSNGNLIMSRYDGKAKVIAWMPLPSPPQETNYPQP